jgi:phage anti-repressor protein
MKTETIKIRTVEADKLLKLLGIDTNKEELIFISREIKFTPEKDLVEIKTKVLK